MSWRRFGRRHVLYGCAVITGGTVAGVWFYHNGWNSIDVVSASRNEPCVKWDSNWDRCDDARLVSSKKVPTATRHLFIIRHGQYESGETDAQSGLACLGQEQAEITGKRLAALNHPYDRLITSTMTRARETADIIHKQFPALRLETSDALHEGWPITPEPLFGQWKLRTEKSQSMFNADNARIESAFRRYFHRADPDQEKDSYEIIVCHANVMRYFVCRALQFPPEAFHRLRVYHASITQISIRPNGHVALHIGDSSHLPPEKVTLHRVRNK